ELVRQLALYLEIPVWDKPAQPCLSSRIPYGTPVSIETLSKIERAEDFLHDLGLKEVRARHHDRVCRIEVAEEEMELALAHRKEIVQNLKKIGYLWVSLDLTGLRSGSLNAQLNLASQNETSNL
ncbi:MAG TPA: TIGR00268 family protein, partial [Dehalococcoidia bacterium]|nr:TIGR00268 family protein [Dehalococcoidia bacterium]